MLNAMLVALIEYGKMDCHTNTNSAFHWHWNVMCNDEPSQKKLSRKVQSSRTTHLYIQYTYGQRMKSCNKQTFRDSI